ncbi:hypothetical protein L9F63_027807 [Diploptera punctata]|uniref:Uncharacterized protein n=1 Tax=Diploptera punctata TaxID=6984 RepID=A0AAD8EHQ6_DIPPU|nr:hypothetical protein L9F63_027807 [Diploptera punctata]
MEELKLSVMLHIYYALLLRRNKVPKIHAVCITTPEHSTRNYKAFINETVSRYNLQFEELENKKSLSLTSLLNCKPHIKAIIVGSLTAHIQRISDYRKVLEENTHHCNILWLTPLAEWTSEDVQKFMKALTLPYYEGNGFSRTTDVLLEAIAGMNEAKGQPVVNSK